MTVILVSGSRDWPLANHGDVWDYLDWLWRTHTHMDASAPFTVRHGRARGVDAYAGQWVRHQRFTGWRMVTEDPWPVTPQQWRDDPKGAGHARNHRMVDAGGITAMVGFQYRGSGGTQGCYEYARDRGIPARLITWEEIRERKHDA